MKAMNVLLLLAALVILTGSLGASAEGTVDIGTLYKNKDADGTWSAAGAEIIDLDAAEGGTVTITQKGDYVLSGTLNGQIIIEAPEDEKVRLILNGASIVSPEGPAIWEKRADKLIVTLAEGTENSLTDGTCVTDGDDTIGAALYAEDDLSVNGSGSLTVNGTQKHGIQSKADLIIAGGTMTVTAALDGIRGRNSVLVLDGEISVTAGGDGIVSTRTDTEGKGWIVLAGGNVSVKTGDGAGEAAAPDYPVGGFGNRGFRDDWRGYYTAQDSGTSRKGVKAAADLTVLGGSYTLDCEDDGLHGANVTVSGGTLLIRSGDDGIHADGDLAVTGGTIDAAQCYEGLEGENVTVSGGDIRVVSSDDGINAAGGNDGSGFGGWGRNAGFAPSGSGGNLTVSGGRISISAGGDGLDSNGSVLITGGVTGVWAATTMGDGAIDFNGTGTVSGGTLIVAGTGGVMRDTAGLTGQTVMVLSVSGGAGETVALKDQNGTVLGEFTPEYAFDTLMVSSDRLPEGSAVEITDGARTLYSGVMTGNMAGVNGNGGFDNGRNRRGR